MATATTTNNTNSNNSRTVVELIDSHCHIDFAEFDHDREKVLSRAASLGIKKIYVPAVAQSSWHRTVDVCSRHNANKEKPELLYALGLHPMFIEQHQPQHLTELDGLIAEHLPIAIGEIGLDFYTKNQDKEKQLAFFSKQLIIANRHHLPVIIHNRKAHDECLQLLTEHKVQGGIIHAFNGSIQQAKKYIDLGFALGFGGMLTYERSNKLRALARELPIESIVLETDAPDMTVAQHRGERNSPEYLPLVLEALSEIKGLGILEVGRQTTLNAEKSFKT